MHEVAQLHHRHRVRQAFGIGFKLQFNDKPVQWPRSRSAYVADPDGILVEFTERFGGGLD